MWPAASRRCTRRADRARYAGAHGRTTNARDVPRLILQQTLRPVAIRIVISITGAAAASQVLKSVRFGLSPLDPIAFTPVQCCV